MGDSGIAAPEERLSNGQFAPKHKKRGGRKKGSLNKASRQVREFLAALVDDGDVQEAVKDRILRGDAVAFFRAIDHVLGKPKESVDARLSGEVVFKWKGE